MFLKEKSNHFLLFIIGMLLVCNTQIYAQSKTNQKPNIIFILTDDLGYGDVGVFFQNQRKVSGDKSKPYELTPYIDQMAEKGARFTDQYANAPVCAPSRASFLTGVHQGNAQVRNNQFDKALEDNHTVANLLKNAGYTTAAIGKWGLQGVKEEAPYWPAHPLKRGFDYFYGYMRHMDGHEHYPKEGLYRGAKEVWENYQNVADGLDKCYTTDLWTAKAKQWIMNQQKEQQPFFMFLAYDAPHAVLELPTQAYPKGGGLKGGLQWLNQPRKMINTASGTIDSYINPEYITAMYDDDENAATPEKSWPDVYKRYASSTKRIDDGVGDIMQLLKDLKIDDNTLVIFTSDNGSSIESYLPAAFLPTFFGSNGPFDGIKRDCWEGGLRVPSIAYWKNKIKPGIVIKQASMLTDWMATFADMAQVPVPARIDGVSLMPNLTGKGDQKASKIYVEYFEGGKTPDFKEFDASHRNRKRNQMQMLRINQYVGVRYNIQSADDDFEIYDMLLDSKQTQNLAKLTAFKNLGNIFKDKALQMRISDAEAKRPYDHVLIPSVSNEVSQFKKGMNWRFYAGNYTYTSFMDDKKPQAKGRVASMNLPNAVKKEGIVIYEGYIQIMEDGKYDFSFQISGKAFVRLHDAILFDADYGYKSNQPLSQTVYLKKGFHPIKISSIQQSVLKTDIQFMWKHQTSDGFQPVQNIIYTHKMEKKAAVFFKK